MATKAVYRPTMDADTIFELVDLMEQVKRSEGLSSNLRKFLSKLDSLAYDIGKGNRAPAYVASGIKANKTISLENLGASEDTYDQFIGTHSGNPNPADLLGTSNMSASTTNISKPSAELDDASLAELEALEKQMLAEVAGNGAGSQNVIPERRKQPRIQQQEHEQAIDISQL